jgi:hypothetical protein
MIQVLKEALNPKTGIDADPPETLASFESTTPKIHICMDVDE